MMCHNHNVKLSALAFSLASTLPWCNAYAQEVEELINPNTREVSLKLPYQTEANPLYRQYNGINSAGVSGSVNLNVIQRSDDGEWTKLRAENLGLTTQEMAASYEKQGSWSIGIEYNQIPRYAPYQVNTAIRGAGTTTITQPAATTANGVSSNDSKLYDLTLKTERDITTLTASRYISDEFKLGFSFKNEDKTGLRMDGVRGVAGTGSPNLYSGFLFAPEPINQRHMQFEGSMDYVSSQYQLSAGYYGSFLNTRNDSLAIVGGTNTLPVTTGATGLSPIALAPNNSLHQLYVNGGYNFSNDTRATLKLAYSQGHQTDSYIYRTDIQPGIGNNLDGKIETKELYASLTSRLSKDLKVLASWRYEDKQDKTPLRITSTAVTGATVLGCNGTTIYCNNPESIKTSQGKLEADYNLGAGYAVTAGADLVQKKSDEWARSEINELTSRAAIRKAMSESVNGTFGMAHAVRTGSAWDPASLAVTQKIYPNYLADRSRDSLRSMVDWSVTENLNIQAAYESYSETYGKNAYGLDTGRGQIFSLDSSYQLNDNWKMSGWYSRQTGDSKQNAQGAACTTASCTTTTWYKANLIQWDAVLKSNSEQIGLGINGKIKSWEIGAQYLYAHDLNKQDLTSLAGATTCTGSRTSTSCTPNQPVISGMGIVPDTTYSQNTFKVFGIYPLSKDTKIRLDYIYDLRKMDDYTWKNWVYADGTKVFVNPIQTTQIIALTFIHSF